MSSMANIRELLIKHRKVQRAKDADRLQPKMGSGRLILSMVGLHGYKHRRRMRKNLTYPLVIYVEHGKPVYLLSCKMAGKLTAMKAEWCAGIR